MEPPPTHTQAELEKLRNDKTDAERQLSDEVPPRLFAQAPHLTEDPWSVSTVGSLACPCSLRCERQRSLACC